MVKGRGKARRVKRKEKRKPSVTVKKTSTVTKLPTKKSYKKETEGLTKGQEKKKSKSGKNNKTTKTGRGIIKEEVMTGIDKKPEVQKARERTVERLGGDEMDRQVKDYQEKQDTAIQEMEAANTPEAKGKKIMDDLAARKAEEESKGQATVRKLKVVNKVLTGGIIALATGILLVGTGGAAAGVAGRVFGKGAATGGRAVITRTGSIVSKSTGRELASATTQRAFFSSKRIGQVGKILKKADKVTVNRVLSGGSKRFLKSPVGKIGVGLAATDGMMAWLASDNILTGSVMYANNIVDAVTFGGLSPQEGLERIEELETTANAASNFVRLSSRVNPALWLFGKPLMTNANQSLSSIEFQKRQLIELTGGRQDE